MERKPWDGVTPITLYDGDLYIYDAEDLECAIDAGLVDPNSAQFVLCEHRNPPEISSDFYADFLPDEVDVPRVMLDKMVENVLWPTKKAVDISATVAAMRAQER